MTLAVYAYHGWIGTKTTMFARRTFTTGAGMVVLIAVELGATLVLLVGAGMSR
jgi:hypothetical protein